jgi:hypothetical protein
MELVCWLCWQLRVSLILLHAEKLETVSGAAGRLLARVFYDVTYEGTFLLKLTGLHNEAPS